MTLLLVVVFVILIALSCGLIVLSRWGRLRRRYQRPIPGNPGVRSGHASYDPGVSSARPRKPRWRRDHRDLLLPSADGGSQAIQRLPGRGSAATLVDEEGPGAALGYESQLVPLGEAAPDQPLGLAVTVVLTANQLPQQDVYYVQRNVMALARGLRPAGVDQRAAALTLSAVVSSQLGRIDDVPEALQDSVESANRVVRSISSRDPEYSNMVTTLDIIFLASNANRPFVHFAHIGNSSVWLLRAAESAVQLLSEPHTLDDGSLMRAVGLSREVLPQIGHVEVQPGDRVFLTSASANFAFTSETMDAVLAYVREPLHDCAKALADAARSSGTAQSITVMVAEVSKEVMLRV